MTTAARLRSIQTVGLALTTVVVASSLSLGLIVDCVHSASVPKKCESTQSVTVQDQKHESQVVATLVEPELNYMVYPLTSLVGNLKSPNSEDMTRLAQTVWGEARGCSIEEQAAVIWCIFNRVDDKRWPDTIEEVCVQSQFHGYDSKNPVEDGLYDLAVDVWYRWQLERAGEQNIGRILPNEYVFFHGDGIDNHFRTEYEHSGQYWDWSLESPYSQEG